ncbi:MAG: ATP-binding protein [Desulfobacterales bacterium]|nr:ATP-binding protein [Desulfobacterales bacterium]
MAEHRSQISFVLHNSLSELEKLSEELAGAAEQWQLPRRAVIEINLVLEELFTNTVIYGFDDDPKHTVSITMDHDIDHVRITMSDKGQSFDPTLPEDPALNIPLQERGIGGLGIFLVRQYVDDLTYKREGDKNIVMLTKKIT